MKKQEIKKQKKSGLRIAIRVLSIIEIVLCGLMIVAGLVLLGVGAAQTQEIVISGPNRTELLITGGVLLGVGFVVLALSILSLVFSNKMYKFAGCLTLGIVTGVLTSILNPIACLLIVTACIDCKKKTQPTK